MLEYEVVLKGNKFILYHEKLFTDIEMKNMVNQAISELKWNGIKRTYGDEINYMIDLFEFKSK